MRARCGNHGRPRLRVEELEPRLVMSTYYVATTGNDNASGAQSTPWLTLQHAADSVVAGDTVIVEAGTYAGFVLGWNAPQNGTKGNPITFQAQSGVIINARNAQTADGIDVEFGSYITVEGFEVLNPAGGSITRAGIRMAGTSEGDQILNNRVDNCGTWDIFTAFANDVLVQGNTCSNAQTQHGIYVSNASTGPQVIGNTVFGNFDCGIQLNGDLSQGGTGLITGALIKNNIIHDNGTGGGSAINLDGVQTSVIENNLLYNNHASGISLFRTDGAAGSINNIVVNNTIIEASDARWDINIQNGSTGNTVLNNILFNNNTNHGSINIATDSLAGLTSDHNVVENLFSPDDGNTFESLAAWQAQTGQDKHSVLATQTATFVSAANNDYHLLSTSPAIGAGISTDAPATDLDGNPRPQGNRYDIGAYEFVGTHFGVSAPASATAGASFSITVTALDPSDKTFTGYSGTVHFTSSDSGATLPGDYTFTNTDAGVHTFTVTLTSAGKQSIKATDTVTAAINGSATVTVSPGAVSTLAVAGYPSPTTAGSAHTYRVTAQDAYGNTVTSYAGTVAFASSDTAAVLPAQYTFQAGDAGVHSFTATLNTGGVQSLQATDTAASGVTGQENIQVLPGATVRGSAAGVRGQTLSFTLGAIEPGLPAATVYTFNINWGDGSSNQTATGTSGTVLTHVFTTSGSYPVSVTVADPNGNTSLPATMKVTVSAVAMETDPRNAALKALFVGGTTGDDKITITPSDTAGGVRVTISGAVQGVFHPTGRIIVYGQSGNDTIQEQAAVINGVLVYVSHPALFFAGGGNDFLSVRGASIANNVLVGGTGNDTIQGGGGTDLLIGGGGQDVIRAGGGRELLLADQTDYDANLQALAAILAEWARTDISYLARISHLLGQTANGLNGGSVLTSSTVHDDTAGDSLIGGAGRDWFIVATNNSDTVTNRNQTEVVTPL